MVSDAVRREHLGGFSQHLAATPIAGRAGETALSPKSLQKRRFLILARLVLKSLHLQGPPPVSPRT
jgi:hypothetical protein